MSDATGEPGIVERLRSWPGDGQALRDEAAAEIEKLRRPATPTASTETAAILITAVTGQRWGVTFDGHTATFDSKQEALDFGYAAERYFARKALAQAGTREARLEAALWEVVNTHDANSGFEPSVSVFLRAIDSARAALTPVALVGGKEQP